MKRPIFETDYWRDRIKKMRHEHQTVFLCSPAMWRDITSAHRRILAEHIKPFDTVLDVGCGYGRMVDLLPEHDSYLGVDFSPDFLARARERYPNNTFQKVDIRKPFIGPDFVGKYDWAILSSMRPMIKREEGDEAWANIEANIQAVATNILYLEYNKDDPGSVE